MNMMKLSRCIKETTVDIAEYERLKKELELKELQINFITNTRFSEGIAEGERRSYEQLNGLKLELCRAKENMKSAQRLALAEGERRAMERVKAAIEKQIGTDREHFWTLDADYLEKELGLDKKEEQP